MTMTMMMTPPMSTARSQYDLLLELETALFRSNKSVSFHVITF
jgi:hypothetical protein